MGQNKIKPQTSGFIVKIAKYRRLLEFVFLVGVIVLVLRMLDKDLSGSIAADLVTYLMMAIMAALFFIVAETRRYSEFMKEQKKNKEHSDE